MPSAQTNIPALDAVAVLSVKDPFPKWVITEFCELSAARLSTLVEPVLKFNAPAIVEIPETFKVSVSVFPVTLIPPVVVRNFSDIPGP